MALGGREKCVVGKEVRPNTRYLKFQGSIDHVTVMPVVSATGKVYTPVVILPGKKKKYRKKRKAEILQEEAPKQAARKIRAAKKGQKKRPSCRD